ncbi:MAG TPA: penicillin-binding protein activator [Casimicrobiaceae bacterium]|nr:penicillin-binding protein activator [Casimicrobiaceae bacterium]
MGALVALGALSCAQQGPATRPAPIVERPRSVPSSAAEAARTPGVPQPIPPGGVRPPPVAPPEPAVVTAPLAERPDAVPSEPVAVPSVTESRATRPPPASTDLVALIVPLDVPAYARAADAVRAGFLAAAEAAGAKDKCVVIGHKEDGVLGAFDEAGRRGVRVVVGPLLRDDLKTLAIADAVIPWTVALNRLDDGTPLPPAVYSFPLAVESDARVIARRAQMDGVRAIDVIASDPPLMKRMAGAFTSEWIAGGGAAPGALRFDPSPDALTLMRRNLTRAIPDAVVLAVDGNDAALAKSFIGTLPAYASGLLFERPDLAVVRDLNDVRIVEVPWLVTPDAPEIANFQRRDLGSAALDRLYALGIDAFRVSQAFGDDPPERFELEGATGRITLVDGHQFAREGRFGVYRDGRLLPLDTH